MKLSVLDLSIIGLYAAAVLSIGLRAGRKASTAEGCFLVGRQMR